MQNQNQKHVVANELAALLDSKEPLCEELQPYLSNLSHSDLPVLHHPLIVVVPYHEAMAAIHNRHFAYKKEAVAEAKAEGNWSRYVFLHERPYRLAAFLESVQLSNFTDPAMVKEVWMDSENIYQNLNQWRKIWSTLPLPQATMDEEEKAALEALPNPVPVFRGVRSPRFYPGLSWTTSREKAIWFANRFRQKGKKPTLYSGTIVKRKILAHFLGRGEHEIVAFPESLDDKRKEAVT